MSRGVANIDKKLTPQQKYDKKNAKSYTIKVIKTTEQDIIQKLDSEKNKAGYIKSLIRQDISDTKKE